MQDGLRGREVDWGQGRDVTDATTKITDPSQICRGYDPKPPELETPKNMSQIEQIMDVPETIVPRHLHTPGPIQ